MNGYIKKVLKRKADNTCDLPRSAEINGGQGIYLNQYTVIASQRLNKGSFFITGVFTAVLLLVTNLIKMKCSVDPV